MTVTVNRNRKRYGYTDNFKTANLQAYYIYASHVYIIIPWQYSPIVSSFQDTTSQYKNVFADHNYMYMYFVTYLYTNEP